MFRRGNKTGVRAKAPPRCDTDGDAHTAFSNSELLTLEFDDEITDADEIRSMVGAASKRRPASE